MRKVVTNGMADMELVMTGPHDPKSITCKSLGAEYMAYNRQRV